MLEPAGAVSASALATPNVLRCPVCGSSTSTKQRGRAGLLGYRRCAACRHSWSSPPPSAEELRLFYNSRYSIPQEGYSTSVSRQYPFVRRLLSANTSGKGRLLEIGCSYGHMLKRLRADGWKVAGLELDSRAVKYAREQLSLDVHCADVQEANGVLGGTFDCVLAFHVIEHVVDPDAFLRSVSALLRENGLLLLRLPNGDSVAAHSPSGSWEWYLRPEHLNLFSSQSLGVILERNGFDCEQVLSRMGDAHSTVFELLKGTARALTRRDRRSAPRGDWKSPLHSPTKLSNALLKALSGLGKLFEIPLGIGEWFGKPLRPELVVVCRLRRSAAAQV